MLNCCLFSFAYLEQCHSAFCVLQNTPAAWPPGLLEIKRKQQQRRFFLSSNIDAVVREQKSLKKVPWYFWDDFKPDQCRSVEGDLRNMFNVVCTSLIRAEGI